jgi:hypothetical protein
MLIEEVFKFIVGRVLRVLLSVSCNHQLEFAARQYAVERLLRTAAKTECSLTRSHHGTSYHFASGAPMRPRVPRLSMHVNHVSIGRCVVERVLEIGYAATTPRKVSVPERCVTIKNRLSRSSIKQLQQF